MQYAAPEQGETGPVALLTDEAPLPTFDPARNYPGNKRRIFGYGKSIFHPTEPLLGLSVILPLRGMGRRC
jgi:hypothetical protein